MGNEIPGMTLKAIGIVGNTVKQAPGPGYNWREVTSEIVVDSSLTKALDGLEGFSHIIVLCRIHQITTTQLPLKVRPQGRQELPLVGLFATRSPYRPNPIGKTTVRLLECRDNLLRAEGLDATDGTPVMDIKPYRPGYDSVTNTKVPPWVINP